MKILNLTNQESSEIKYEKISFPDGQQQVAIDRSFCLKSVEAGLNNPPTYTDVLDDSVKEIVITSRLNNFMDLELIICAVKSLRNIDYGGQKVNLKVHLEVPYFLGSRSDRKFKNGECNYLKEVICPIINGLNLESITVLDPHSDVLEACLNNYHKKDNHNLIEFALNDLDIMRNCVNILSPDAGALKKIYEIGKKFDIDQIVTANKIRENGKIVRTEIPEHCFYNNDVFIIDDICDGGKTFIEIGKALKNTDCGKKYLIVTHGIFSKGFLELEQHFDGIYCTNSYSDLGAITSMINIKQLNIF